MIIVAGISAPLRLARASSFQWLKAILFRLGFFCISLKVFLFAWFSVFVIFSMVLDRLATIIIGITGLKLLPSLPTLPQLSLFPLEHCDERAKNNHKDGGLDDGLRFRHVNVMMKHRSNCTLHTPAGN